MQSPLWDNEAGRGRRSPRGRQDYGGAEAKTKKLFKQKAPRVLPSLSDAQTLVFALTVVYLFTVNLFYLAFFRHPKAVLLMCAAPLVAVPAMWARRSRSTFNLSLGAAVLCGLLLGVLAGLYCYASFGYFSWTYYNSRSYENVVSSEDPQIVADGAKITFAGEAFLDQSRSVGFKAPDGHLYCCAPIGSHAEAEAPVNFWAVGVDCCDLSGRFECDAAPKQTAHGLILLDEPFRWFRGTLRERFHDAKRKSAATFGIATGESEPVFLRWVTKEEYLDAQRFYDREALLFIVLSTFLVGASSSTLAWAFRPKDLSTALGV